MKSMALTAEEAKEYTDTISPRDPGDAPKYPYGLCLYLNDETLKKLGIEGLPVVGSTMTLEAKVIVVSIGMSQQQDGDKEQRAELQITDMDLHGETKSAASVLYS